MLTYKTGHSAGNGNVSIGQRIDGNSSGFILLTAPLIGLLYVVSLPFIGIATVATLASSIIMTRLYNLAAKTISFGWRPSNAYLSGKNKKKHDGK
jgi:hypothetical protein